MPEPTPDLIDATVAWQSALLDSASTDIIGVSSWWDRAATALTTAAASADTYAQAVSTACRKLQIDVLDARSSKALADLEKTIGPRLAEWSELATRDANRRTPAASESRHTHRLGHMGRRRSRPIVVRSPRGVSRDGPGLSRLA